MGRQNSVMRIAAFLPEAHYGLTDRLAIRPFKVDHLMTRFSETEGPRSRPTRPLALSLSFI